MQRLRQSSSRKASSPTAQLLRSSRLFSIPEPLPRPDITKNRRGSPNTTLPYPIYQAIEAPLSSASRGDYGLKRTLPLKRLRRQSSPVVRVVELDAIENVTDYEFAADHVQTLQKLQELSLSITARKSRQTLRGFSAGNPISAFDTSVDNTALSQNPADPSQVKLNRWKYSKPSITELTENEFASFRSRFLDSGNLPFMAFLKERFKQSYMERRAPEHLGEPLQGKEIQVFEDDFDTHLTLLRDELKNESNFAVSRLARYVEEFFDLPRPKLEQLQETTSWNPITMSASVDANLTTHPSAGVSYLRTHHYLENHPTLGPLEKAPPVEARILRNSNMPGWGRATREPTVGIAGIATSQSSTATGTATAANNPNSIPFDPTVEGGQRIHVHPGAMHILPSGKIHISYEIADVTAQAIKEGKRPEFKTVNTFRRGAANRYTNMPFVFEKKTAPRTLEGDRTTTLGYGIGTSKSNLSD